MEQFCHHDRIRLVLGDFGPYGGSIMRAEMTPGPTTFYAIWNKRTA